MTIRPIPLTGLAFIIKVLRTHRGFGADPEHDIAMQEASKLVEQIKHQHDDEPGYFCGKCGKWITGSFCAHIGENREQLRARVDMLERDRVALREHIGQQAVRHKEAIE